MRPTWPRAKRDSVYALRKLPAIKLYFVMRGVAPHRMRIAMSIRYRARRHGLRHTRHIFFTSANTLTSCAVNAQEAHAQQRAHGPPARTDL